MIKPNVAFICVHNSCRSQMAEALGKKLASDVFESYSAGTETKPQINVIFAAAPSQNEVLASLVADKDIDWSRINAYHMDEYIGLDADAPQGFGNFLREHIFDRVPFASVNLIDVTAKDADAEAARYGEMLDRNPADVVVMGIGENGHIAFNDPPVADFCDPKTVKAVELDEMRVFRRFFEDVAVVSDVGHERHDEFFANRVDRRIRDLGEELVEAVG